MEEGTDSEFTRTPGRKDVAYLADRETSFGRLGRLLPGLWWRQWAMVLIGIAAITATVAVSDMARRDAERHRRVQVLSEQVSVASQQLSSVTWEALADSWAGGSQHLVNAPAFVNKGFLAWRALSSSLNALRAAGAGSELTKLNHDSDVLFSAGTHALKVFLHRDLKTTMQLERGTIRPELDALDTDSQRAAAAQRTVADRASRRAAIANVGSLVCGFLLMLLLGWSLHRMHRRSLLAKERRALERRSEDRIRALVEHASDVISVVDHDLRVQWQSSSIQHMLGHDSESLVGRRLTEWVHPEDAPLLASQVESGAARAGTVTFSVRFRHADGSWRDLETIAASRFTDPAVAGVILSMRDVTDRKALEDELRHQAFHDALTGLANRALFEDRLAHGLAGARRHRRPITVLFLDLDDFKTINDSLGHTSGDELLRAVAMRIAGVVRAADTAARLGGDEFAVLVDIMDHEVEARALAARILEELEPPFKIAGRELNVSASIGMAISDGSRGADELLRNADTAMYAAKESGKNCVRAFEEGMHVRVLDRLELTGELRRALEIGEFELDYQPIVELDTGRIAGVEALVRWAHPDRGRLAPARFIGLAEETGLIVPLGAWILNCACTHAREWQRSYAHGSAPHISVNVSTRQLCDPGFPQIVAEALQSTGVQSSALVLEITESLLADDNDEIISRLQRLKALGVRIAVDDFGTGYSALSRLGRYPIDILKIDRSFSDGIDCDPGKAQLVNGIVNLAESLHLEVVVEGIEESRQAAKLREMHASFGQGNLFSRPVSGAQVQDLLLDGKCLLSAATPQPREPVRIT